MKEQLPPQGGEPQPEEPKTKEVPIEVLYKILGLAQTGATTNRLEDARDDLSKIAYIVRQVLGS